MTEIGYEDGEEDKHFTEIARLHGQGENLMIAMDNVYLSLSEPLRQRVRTMYPDGYWNLLNGSEEP